MEARTISNAGLGDGGIPSRILLYVLRWHEYGYGVPKVGLYSSD